MTLPPFSLLLAAVPVIALGEGVLRIAPPLRRMNLPAAIAGGLLVSFTFLAINLIRPEAIRFEPKTISKAWLWIVTPETRLSPPAAKPIFLPLSAAFFTCVGLNASWIIARRGSWLLLILLASATVLGAMQNVLGVAIAKLAGASPLLGVMCGSVTLTGGLTTALGYGDKFEALGLQNAAAIGTAAATFGIVTASLLAGAVGGLLIQRRSLRSASKSVTDFTDERSVKSVSSVKSVALFSSWFSQVARLRPTGETLTLIAVLLLCLKAGAWLNIPLEKTGVTFPAYMGPLFLGIVARNLFDALSPGTITTDSVNALAGVLLAPFLAMATASLDLASLAKLAGPMIAILVAQIPLTIAFAWLITFRVLGKNYDAAVATAGHVGFGLGITPNAVASVDVLQAKFGPSPRALLIVTLVGGMLIDLTNTGLISLSLKLLGYNHTP